MMYEMPYSEFQSLKAEALETYDSMAQLLEKFGWNFFTEEASHQIEAYELLDDGYKFAGDANEMVRFVANQIGRLKEEAKDADDREVIKYLVRYIRDNYPDELWDEYQVFNLSHLHRGC